MDPVSFSATSLDAAGKCMSRYEAEFIKYTKNFQGSAASVGIVCHGTFEDFLRAVYIKRDKPWDYDLFMEIFHENAAKELGPDRTTEEYKDAETLCIKWFNAPNRKKNLDDVTILSLESKNNFPMKTAYGERPVNFIMDRLERIAPGEYRVVDYKSNRIPITENQLRRRLQARLYALAVQIKYKDAQKIWVQFEFLRHGPVEVLFTRDDNVVMYRELQRRIKEINDIPDGQAKETLNADCGWCVKKATCKALLSNAAGGGISGLSIDELAKLHHTLTGQSKAVTALMAQVEDLLLQEAIKNNLTEYQTDVGVVKVKAGRRRTVDSDLAGKILGELAGEYQKFSVTDLDAIIKKKVLPPQQAELLKMAITSNLTEPKIQVEYDG